MDSKELETLKKLQQSLSKDGSLSADAVRIDDPIDAIEDSLSDFVRHGFKCVEDSRAFEQMLQTSIQNRLPEATFAQLIKLLEVTQAGNAVDTSNLINPFAQAAVAKHQADAIAEREGKTTSQKVYDNASKEILQGLTALNQLLETATNIAQTPANDDKKEKD